MARGRPRSDRIAEHSFSKAAAMRGADVDERPHPGAIRAASSPPIEQRLPPAGTSRWRASSHAAACATTPWRASGAACHTTEWTIAPSLNRRVSLFSPQSRFQLATAAASDGVGPRSTSEPAD